MRLGTDILVGRERELAELRGAADRAIGGRLTTAVLLGPAGVGKSRLAAESARMVEGGGGLAVTSHGLELAGGELPFAGLGELVRGVVRGVGLDETRRLLGDQVAALAPLHPALGGPGAGATPERAAVTAAVLTLVDGVAAARPLQWVLDDLPWLDAPTRDAATYLTAVAPHLRLLMVATVRGETHGAVLSETTQAMARVPGALVLSVAPLTSHEVAIQVRALYGRDASLDVVRRICQVSDGLPFFVEQLVAAGGRTPVSLRRLLLDGMEGLSDDARWLLCTAAIGEPLLRLDLLRTVSGLGAERFRDAVAEVRRAGVLVPGPDGGELRFRHVLLREAVEADVPSEERQDLHRRWAELIESWMVQDVQSVVLRATHRDALEEPAEAFLPVLAAAKAVSHIADTHLQARWWGRALELWPGRGDVGGTSRDRAVGSLRTALLDTGQWEASLRLMEAELADVRAETGWLRRLWLRGAIRWIRLRFDEYVAPVVDPEEADAVLQRLADHPTDFRVEQTLHSLLHEWDVTRPDLYAPTCEVLLRRAVQDGDSQFVHLALRHQGWWELAHGDAEEALARAWAALERTGGAADVRHDAEVDVAWALVHAAGYREAVTFTARAMAGIVHPHAVPLPYGELACALALALFHLDDLGGALEATERGLAVVPPGSPQARLHPSAARIRARGGWTDEAESELAALPAAGPDPGSEVAFLRVMRGLALAEVALSASDVTGSRAALGHAAGLVLLPRMAAEAWELLVMSARGGVVRGETSQRGFVDELARMAGVLPLPTDPTRHPHGVAAAAEMAAHRARAVDRDSAGSWEAVRQQWEALGRGFDAAWCRLLEAECRGRDGERAAAHALLEEAGRTAERIGAGPLQQRIEVAARRGRLAVVGRGGVPASGLTPREAEVLQLVARGSTNAQIARELVLSPKTVSVHVSRIIAKLSAANRTEAVALARGQGLLE